jgi:L-aminopeptidase/D-esterase-like protein
VDPDQVTTPPWEAAHASGSGENTTIGVVATNATLTKGDCLLVAQSAHDGMARALEPVHTAVDGDAVVAASVGGVEAPLERVRLLAARATERAIRAAGAS